MNCKKMLASFMAFVMSLGAIHSPNYSPDTITAAIEEQFGETVSFDIGTGTLTLLGKVENDDISEYNNNENVKTIIAAEGAILPKNCEELFKGSKARKIDLSKADTINVTNMRSMFEECKLLTFIDLSGFNTQNVTDMNSMFLSCEALPSIDVSGFDTSNVTGMSRMFKDCSSLTNLDVSGFNTSKAAPMFSMFEGCSSLKDLDVSSFDTSNATYIFNMFKGCSSLKTLDLSGFNTPNAISMVGMFMNCSALTTLDISGFTTKSLMNMYESAGGCSSMFENCSSLKTIYVSKDLSFNDDDGTDLFAGCKVLVGGNGTEFDENNTGISYARIDSPDNHGYFTEKQQNNITTSTVSPQTTTATTTTTSTKQNYTLGDVNNDGFIDAVDSSQVLVYYAKVSTNSDGGFTDEQKLAADMNHDELIDAVDASLILAYYARISTSNEVSSTTTSTSSTTTSTTTTTLSTTSSTTSTTSTTTSTTTTTTSTTSSTTSTTSSTTSTTVTTTSTTSTTTSTTTTTTSTTSSTTSTTSTTTSTTSTSTSTTSSTTSTTTTSTTRRTTTTTRTTTATTRRTTTTTVTTKQTTTTTTSTTTTTTKPATTTTTSTTTTTTKATTTTTTRTTTTTTKPATTTTTSTTTTTTKPATTTTTSTTTTTTKATTTTTTKTTTTTTKATTITTTSTTTTTTKATTTTTTSTTTTTTKATTTTTTRTTTTTTKPTTTTTTTMTTTTTKATTTTTTTSATPSSTTTTVLTTSYADYLIPPELELEINTSIVLGDPSQYLTPQQFGAKGDGYTDDTQAFRKLFKAAYDASSISVGWKHAKSIFIPSGAYLIKGTVIDEDSDIRYAMFDITGAGRENTTIQFRGDVLFDNQTHDDPDDPQKDRCPIFSFTTFRNIGFIGNESNTFMNIRDSYKLVDGVNVGVDDGVQRLQFISCSFEHFNKILNSIESTIMLSEITFAFCKIASCGTTSNPCKLFVLNCPQGVNWRFIYTDIESFNGDAFYYMKGMNLSLLGGSIIPFSGSVFNLDLYNSEKAATAGSTNAPHIHCTNSRFEIRGDSSLIKTTVFYGNVAKAIFNGCCFGTVANNSPNFLMINGGLNASFDECFGCECIRLNGNVTKNGWLVPKLTFTRCPDLNLEYLIQNTKIKNEQPGLTKNNVHVKVDNSYDFFIVDNDYFHTVSELEECRQVVKLSEYDSVGLPDGKTITTKPYGYVKYVELTVIKNETFGENYPVTLTFYDNGKKISEPTKITFEANKTYKIEINDFVDELQAVFTHSNSKNPNADMSMEIIKY